ncbi:RNA-directed DNA polymerase from mobile element jockey [Caerostris extrusa]|uniref:RNA-directed DNA polymerase from mobile element jockey n=1 Tax=Caerostris extrusa TaxID=172846 RepID=A0AAV4RNB5_CAEEX|nr:RNA-directed DNA polymerase from mobile element jockey [Caerostris extrusa]
MHKNDMGVVELRRFVKLNSTQEFSPVLVTILGTFLPDVIKIWFTKQKIRQFVYRVRQCLNCYEFTNATRVCDKKIMPSVWRKPRRTVRQGSEKMHPL